MGMVDRFHCPAQTTETFSFDFCRSCPRLEISRGVKINIHCRENRERMNQIAFESAFLLHSLGMSVQVEIVK